jgi:threonine dehydratase
MTFVDPFDNFHVIAGQGTLALKLFDETGELDYLLMAIGGGGLVSGCCLVSKTFYPKC